MNLVTYNISLDVHKTSTQAFISAIRGDTSRVIVASLSENGRPYDIAEGCTAVFTAVKPDGKFIYNDCGIDTEKNTITYKLTSQTTAVSGEVKCQFKLIGKDGSVLGIPEFSIIVGDTLYNEEPIVESSEEFHALTAYIAELQQMLVNGELKGEPGDPGPRGPQGEKGETGATGAPGKDGADGKDGIDGRDADPNLFANALKGAASGASVYVEDVSPLEHDVKLKLSSDSITDFSGIKVIVASEQIESVGQLSDAKNGANCVDVTFANGSRKIFVGDTTSVDGSNETVLVFPESNWDTYASVIVRSNSYEHLRYDNADGDSVYRDVPVNFYWEHSSSEDGEVDRLLYESYELPEVEGYTAAMGEVFIKDLTVELITQAGSEIGTCEIVVPEADGAVADVKCIAPTMAVTTDNSAVIVNLEYNRNTNDALAAAESRMQNLCSNALKESASGEVIRVDDVSPLEHNVAVKLLSKNLAKVYGFSAIGMDTPDSKRTTQNNYGTVLSTTESSNSLTVTQNQAPNADIGSDYRNGYFYIGCYNIAEETEVTFSVDVAFHNNPLNIKSFSLFCNGKSMGSITNISGTSRYSITFNWHTNGDMQQLEIRPCGVSGTFSNFQIELGDEATSYEPYVDLSTATVTRCGKNLIESEKIPNEQWPNVPQFSENGVTWTTSETREVAVEGTTPDGAFSVFSIASGKRFTDWLVDGKTYVISLNKTGTGDLSLFVDVVDKESGNVVLYITDGTVFTVNKSKYTYGTLRLQVAPGKTVNAIVKPQIEVGDTATDYEAYKGETYAPNADGTLEIPSLSPSMTLFADVEGVNIDVEYNQDTNALKACVERLAVDIEAGLDSIIAIQESLIGGAAE